MSALTKLTVTETKLFLREPIVVFFAVAFAPILLIILGLIPTMREPVPELNGLRMIDVYIPIVVSMGIALFALSGLSQLFASYREKGILRRLRTTPVKPAVMIGAQLLMATIMSIITMLVILTIGKLAFNVDLPGQIPAYLITYLLVALAMFAIGLLVAALAPSSKSASAVGSLVFFPLIFFAGLWLPRENMNDTLRTISDLTPLGAGVQALQDATGGSWPSLLHLSVLAAWTIISGALAARYFRWS